MDVFLYAVRLVVLRVGGFVLALVASCEAYCAMWFRLEGSDELKMIEQVDLEIGAQFGLALLLYFAPDCRRNIKAWTLAIVSAATIWAGVSGFLIWRHREQDRIRSSPSLLRPSGVLGT
jgi:hypothetical protein